jgi:putative nucleotidyltransferase with HDIG domain
MINIFDKSQVSDIKLFSDALAKEEEITIRTYAYSDDYDYLIERLLEKILAKYRLELLKNPLTFCIRELIGNSRKAIVKRMLFKEKKLDIQKISDYEKGMKFFHKFVFSEIDRYSDKMKEEGYFISFAVNFSSEGLSIKIENNTELTKPEHERIRAKLERVHRLNDLGQQLDTIIDTTEGAGLGLIMLIMMLRKEGINPKAFNIGVNDGKTVAKIDFLKADLKETPFSVIAKSLINEVKSLPQFPDNITKIIKLLADKNVDLSTIAGVIIKDPSLTADLLKLANSAFFMLPKRVKSIEEALKIIGLKGLRNLIYSYGTITTLEKYFGKTPKLELIWQHSYKVSYYAKELAKILNLKEIIEEAAIGGLLHDLGKILIMSIEPEKLENIKTISGKKDNIPPHLVEELLVGINHAKLGSMVAEHWNFPDNLVRSIEYHHIPGFATDALIPLVYSVYFANALTDIERGMSYYKSLNKEVLEYFKIKNDDDLKSVHNRLKASFELKLKETTENRA